MLERKKDYHAWLYLAIPILLLSVFTFYPLIKTILISFDPGYNVVQDAFSFEFGLSNFIKVWNYKPFRDQLVNTLLIVVVTVPISTILALLIAVGLNSIKPLQKIFQTIFFMPYVTNTIAIGMVFAVLFASPVPNTGGLGNGLINSIFGIDKEWLGLGASLGTRRLVLHSYIIWNALPFKILVFIGGLQNIGKQYYDAAKIDATPKARIFRKITVPLLSPIISYVLITSFIGAFKSYDAIVGVFGDPATVSSANEMNTVVGFVYYNIGRDGSNYPQAAAAAVILFAIILLFTVINMYVSKKRVHY